jgi:hypothetical protein
VPFSGGTDLIRQIQPLLPLLLNLTRPGPLHIAVGLQSIDPLGDPLVNTIIYIHTYISKTAWWSPCVAHVVNNVSGRRVYPTYLISILMMFTKSAQIRYEKFPRDILNLYYRDIMKPVRCYIPAFRSSEQVKRLKISPGG